MIGQNDAELLTVGLPVHNAMPYLPQALESLLQQSMPHFRILAVVDGSTDDSLDYLLSINDKRLQVINQPHRGVAYTLNRMLREARSPWLVRQDADDISTQDRLATICHAIEDHPDAGMFYSHAAYYPVTRSVGLFRSTRGTPEQIRSLAQAGYVPAICHPSAVLHIERTLAVGGYRGGLQCEDADLWWRMALQYDIRFIPEVLLFFRQNAGSLTSHNMQAQELHGLYVQYLLLSRLHGRKAAALASVEGELARMLASGPMKAKEQLRRFNIYLGEGETLRALQSLAASLVTSPGYFLRRLRDELLPTASIANGLAPRLYLQRKEALWPQDRSTQITT